MVVAIHTPLAEETGPFQAEEFWLVPPLAAVKVPVVSVRAMPREEVAMAVGTAEIAEGFPKTELALIEESPALPLV